MKVKNAAALKAVLDRGGMDVDEEGRVSAKPAPAAPPQSNTEVLAAVKGNVSVTKQIQEFVQAGKVESPTIEPVKTDEPATDVRDYLFRVESIKNNWRGTQMTPAAALNYAHGLATGLGATVEVFGKIDEVKHGK